MIPRFGQARRRDVNYQRRDGAYAVLARGRKLLLTYQANSDEPFQLPGGGIDPGESAIAALHRETLEETGWRISTPTRLGVFRRFVRMPEYDLWAEKVCHIYLAQPVRRLGEPSEAFHTAHWVDVDLAVELLDGPGDRAFAELFRSVHFE